MTQAVFPQRPPNVAALVTGGGGDIARAVATRLIAMGLPVALVDLRQDAAEHTASQLRAAEARVAAYQADVSKEADVARVVAEVEAALGPVAVLVNTAGILQPERSVRDLSLADWRRVMDVNLNGCFLTARATLPTMQRLGWGRIVSISSSLAMHTRPNTAAYASSKAAILGLTRSITLENASKGITANAVIPSLVDTAMPRQHWSDEEMARRARATSMGRLAHPEDIAAAIAYLVSDEAAYVNGTSLVVAGGTFIPA